VRPLLAAALVLLASCARETRAWADGRKRLEGPVAWFGRRPEGLWTWWYPNGALREQGRYEDGRRTGVWVQWYPNGQRRSRGARRWNPATGASEREGAWIFWHENGAERAQGIFRAGRREGHWDYSLDVGGLDGVRTGEYHDDLRID